MASIPNKSNSPDKASENYSVDEMMARLKKGERQKRGSSQPSADQQPEGELVTREDGTQVIKVRRRKRRSKQPPKKKPTSQTNPKLKWAILGSGVALLLILVVGTIFVIAKYNGRTFKEKTESTITTLAGSDETELTQLQVTPLSAKAQKVELAWGKQAFIKDASFSNIRAKINAASFFSSYWIGEEIVSSQGVVHLQSPQSVVEASSDTTESPYQFGSYRCNELTLFFGPDRSSPAIHELQVSLRTLDNEQSQIVFHNGTMKVKNWPNMQLSSGIVTLTSQSATLDAQLKAKASHGGEMTIKGTIAKNTSSPAVLDVTAKNFPIEELLGQDLGRLIQGEIQSEAGTFSYDYNKPTEQSISFILPFNSTDIRFEGLPLFKELNKLIGNTSYIRPLFHRSKGTILRTPDGLSLNDLEFLNNSLLLLHGDIAISAKGQLSGTLSVAVPQTVFDDNPPKPFTGPRGGFYHIEVTLGGTVQTPDDNLHQLLKASQPTRKAKPRVQLEDLLQSPPPTNEKQAQPKPEEKDFDDLIQSN